MSPVSPSNSQEKMFLHSILAANYEAELKKALTEHGVDKITDLPKSLQAKILSTSAVCGSPKATKYLLDQNIDPNSTTSSRSSPLRSVVLNASYHVTSHPYLYTDSTPDTQCPFDFIERQKCDLVDNVRLLLERGANPSAESVLPNPNASSSGLVPDQSVLQIVRDDDYKHKEIRQLVLDHVEANKSPEPPTASLRSVACLTVAVSVVVLSVGLYVYSGYRGEEETSEGYFGEMFS